MSVSASRRVVREGVRAGEERADDCLWRLRRGDHARDERAEERRPQRLKLREAEQRLRGGLRLDVRHHAVGPPQEVEHLRVEACRGGTAVHHPARRVGEEIF